MAEVKKLLCIKYPGLVENSEKAIETLGGLEKIADTYFLDHRQSRLELKFRPGNAFCKPVCGERVERKGILLKVKRRKSSSDVRNDPCHAEVLGYVTTVFRFEALCDFQYLPMTTHFDGRRPTLFNEEIGLKKWRNVDYFKEDLADPYYLPPFCFSRFDRPVGYNFKDRFTTSLQEPTEKEREIIDEPLRQRSIGSQLLQYSVRQIPAVPTLGTLENYENLPESMKSSVNVLRDLFEKRPVWSKIAISDESQLPEKILKNLLPMVAYYFLSGPWRYCWLRLGYDPRIDPNSRKYQVIDFRVRKPIRQKAGFQRSAFSHLAAPVYKKSQGDSLKSEQREGGFELGKVEKRSVVTEMGIYLKHVQVMYQICDLHIEPAFDALKLPVEEDCSDSDGYFPKGTVASLRERMNEHVDRLLLQHCSKIDATEEDVSEEDEEMDA